MPIPFDSYPTAIGGRDWGANWEEALQDYDRRACSTFAVDKMIGRSGKARQRACGLRAFPVAKGNRRTAWQRTIWIY
jgi:hypothetical protein